MIYKTTAQKSHNFEIDNNVNKLKITKFEYYQIFALNKITL